LQLRPITEMTADAFARSIDEVAFGTRTEQARVPGDRLVRDPFETLEDCEYAYEALVRILRAHAKRLGAPHPSSGLTARLEQRIVAVVDDALEAGFSSDFTVICTLAAETIWACLTRARSVPPLVAHVWNTIRCGHPVFGIDLEDTEAELATSMGCAFLLRTHREGPIDELAGRVLENVLVVEGDDLDDPALHLQLAGLGWHVFGIDWRGEVTQAAMDYPGEEPIFEEDAVVEVWSTACGRKVETAEVETVGASAGLAITCDSGLRLHVDLADPDQPSASPTVISMELATPGDG
jgi:hypothetical protein